MPNDPVKVLFLCTGNSCRSQMAEAMLRAFGSDRFQAYSAGSHPAGYVHPLAVEAMNRLDISMDGQSSKSWDEYAHTPIDLVVTVCDAAAQESCPVWPGGPICVNWLLPDPAGHYGDIDERIEFAMRVAERLSMKVQALVELDWSTDSAELRERLEFLGEI